MKTNSPTQSNFAPAAAQTRGDSVPLREQIPQTKTKLSMIRKAILLLGFLAVASPPLLQGQITETHTFTTNRVVPDGNASGLHDVRSVSSAIAQIASVKVRLKINGEFNGDLYGYVRHSSGFSVLLNRPGKTADNTAGYDDSGFDVTFATSGASGDVHTYRSVTAPASGSPLTGNWEPDGRIADPAVVTDASSRGALLSSFNGLDANGEWTLYLADLESGGTNQLREWALEITGAVRPALAWANPADIVYGTALGGSQLNAAVTYASTNVNGTFAYTPAAGTVLNAGLAQTLSVTFTPADTASFLPVSTNVSINVQKAPLVVTADDKSKLYGAALPTLTASYSGFVNSDTTAKLTTLVSLSTGASASSDVGTYPITASGVVSSNYTPSYVAGTLTVDPAPLGILADDKSKVYGSANPPLTASYFGFVNSDTPASLDTPVSLNTAADDSSPVGDYAITATGAADHNYSITFTNGTLSVTRAPITVTADNKTKVYGAPLPELTATYTGFVLAQGTNDLPTLATVTTVATASSPVGTYPITASGAASPNYLFAYVAGSLTITQSLTVGAIASSANPALPGANVTFTMTVTAAAPGVGTPSGTVNFRIDGSIAGSGALSGGVATFTINTLALGSHTVTAEYAGDLNFVGSTNALTPNQVINTPPVAGADTIERYPTQSVKVRLSTLLANDSDADGDTLTPVVSSTSANGGTITLSGGWVTYTPASGWITADTFTYTIADGRGAVVTCTVTVNIKVDVDPGQNLTITDLSGGSYRIRGSGIPGRTYRLQFTDTLTPADWQLLPGAGVTADASGVFEFTDTSGSATRYYRSVYP
jgi:subtilisin-like proprotein convertase family protein